MLLKKELDHATVIDTSALAAIKIPLLSKQTLSDVVNNEAFKNSNPTD